MNLHPAATDILRRYERHTKSSRMLMQRAARVMPGGNTRTTSFHPPYPVVFDHGKGPFLVDVDGRRYVDLFCNGLSIIHGHAYPPIRKAAAAILKTGTAWSGASRPQIAFAQLLSRRLGGKLCVRFANSGSEAGMLAVKIARQVTGRPLILKFDRAYHGLYPDLEAGLYGIGEKPGVTLLARFNDLASCEAAFDSHRGMIAAVIYEPVLITGRVVTPADGFLQALEALARKHGALSILDDCLMLRLAKGGSAECFGLRPDLTVLGKFIGGGTPLGAVVGREEAMSILDPTKRGSMFHGGSFNGNVLGCAAGIVALAELTAAAIREMDRHAAVLRERLATKAAELGIEVAVSGLGSVGGIAFASDATRHEDNPSALGLSALYHLACCNEGVSIGPGGLFAMSTAIDDVALETAALGMEQALGSIAAL